MDLQKYIFLFRRFPPDVAREIMLYLVFNTRKSRLLFTNVTRPPGVSIQNYGHWTNYEVVFRVPSDHPWYTQAHNIIIKNIHVRHPSIFSLGHQPGTKITYLTHSRFAASEEITYPDGWKLHVPTCSPNVSID